MDFELAPCTNDPLICPPDPPAPIARDASNSRVLFMKGLPYRATEADIRRFFNNFTLDDREGGPSPILIVNIGFNKGNGFVRFQNAMIAGLALENCQRRHIDDRYILLLQVPEENMVQERERLERLSNNKNAIFYIRGLDYTTSFKELDTFVRSYIPEDSIISLDICYTLDDRLSGDAFLELKADIDPQVVLQMDHKTLKKRYLEVLPSSADERDRMFHYRANKNFSMLREEKSKFKRNNDKFMAGRMVHPFFPYHTPYMNENMLAMGPFNSRYSTMYMPLHVHNNHFHQHTTFMSRPDMNSAPFSRSVAASMPSTDVKPIGPPKENKETKTSEEPKIALNHFLEIVHSFFDKVQHQGGFYLKVSNLPAESTEDSIRAFFEGVLVLSPYLVYDDTGETFAGIAYLHVATTDDVERALCYDGQVRDGKTIKVERSSLEMMSQETVTQEDRPEDKPQKEGA